MYCFAAFVQMFFSCVFHWFYPIGGALKVFLHKMDLASIAILTYATSFSLLFYHFYCIKTLLWGYSLLALLTNSYVFLLTFQTYESSKRDYNKKVFVYVMNGVVSCWSLLHALYSSYFFINLE